MKPGERQMADEDAAVMSELRPLLERARWTLTVASDRADEDGLSGVCRSLRGADARLEEALRHLLGSDVDMEREVDANVGSTDELDTMLTEVRRLLGESAELAERAQHTGAVDIIDDVGEAASLVNRATRELLRQAQGDSPSA